MGDKESTGFAQLCKQLEQSKHLLAFCTSWLEKSTKGALGKGEGGLETASSRFAETGNSIKQVCWCASLLKLASSIRSIPTAQPASFSVCPLGFRSDNGQTFTVIFKSFVTRVPVLLTSINLTLHLTRNQGWDVRRPTPAQCARAWTST